MGERSDQDYHGYGHRLDWARNQKPKRPKEDFAEREAQRRSLESMEQNMDFWKGESALRTQIPLFVQNPDGDYERTYSDILPNTTQKSNTVAFFTKAGLDPRHISCKTDFFPEVRNLHELIESVTSYRDQVDKLAKNDSMHQQDFVVKLSEDQFQDLKSYYSELITKDNGSGIGR
jgi:hypothetical protein